MGAGSPVVREVGQRPIVLADHLPVRVLRVGLDTQADGDLVGLGATAHEGNQLGRLADRQGQHARGQRI